MKPEGYSIKDLEVLSGIKAHTIRIWEKRYNLLEPKRTDTNIRFYNDEDLRKILNVSLLVNNGFKISKISRLDHEEIKERVLSVTEVKSSESDYLDRLILMMLNFDTIGINRLTKEIIARLGLEVAVINVFFVLFQRIGTYWQVGSIFPAQEHFITNIFRQRLIAEIDKLEAVKSNGMTMLFFLPDHELHEMSLLFYSYLALKEGYHVVYLGQVVPSEDLVKIQLHLKVDYVFTAFINSIPKNTFEEYLIKINDIFQQQKIFITGWQIHVNNPELPPNFKIIKDHKEFKACLA